MMKKIFLVISLLIAVLLVSACAPQVSDAELEAKLETLSDQDLDAVIDVSSQGKALAGQATAIELGEKAVGISKDRLLTIAQAVKIKRLEKKVAMLEKGATVVHEDFV